MDEIAWDDDEDDGDADSDMDDTATTATRTGRNGGGGGGGGSEGSSSYIDIDGSEDGEDDADAIASLLLLPTIPGSPNHSRPSSPPPPLPAMFNNGSNRMYDTAMSPEQIATFSELTTGINWLVEDEMLSLQRADDGFSSTHLQQCIKHLKTRAVVSSPSLVQRIDLYFVEESGYGMFARELSFEALQGYAMEEAPVAEGSTPNGSFYIRASDSMQAASIDALKALVPLAPESGAPEVWVGQRFTMPSLFDEEPDGAESSSSARLPFTLSIRVTRTQVELFFHSRGTALTFEIAVLNAVKTLVCRARARVNELLLLEEVATSQPHTCNPALLVGSGGGGNDGDGVGGDGDGTRAATKADVEAAKAMGWYALSEAAVRTKLTRYPAGAFRCRQVFTRDFILHRRLPASQALFAITQVLAHLTVRNRENQFVYRQQSTNDVFLLHFTTIELGNGDEQQGGGQGSSSQVEVDTLTFDRPPDRVRLQVCGVRPVGEAIGRDLIEMLSNLIDSAAVTVLSERLAKIAKLRLTAADLEFLTSNSSNGQPNTRIVLPLPKAVENSAIFLEYFKQHMRQYLLPYMGLAEKGKDASLLTAAASAAQQRRAQKSGARTNNSNNSTVTANGGPNTATPPSDSKVANRSTPININIAPGAAGGGGGDGNSSSVSPTSSSSPPRAGRLPESLSGSGDSGGSSGGGGGDSGSSRKGRGGLPNSAPVILQNIDFDFIYSHGAAVKGLRQQRLKARRPTQARRAERESTVREQVTAAVGRGIALISSKIRKQSAAAGGAAAAAGADGAARSGGVVDGSGAAAVDDEAAAWDDMLKSLSATLEVWSNSYNSSSSSSSSNGAGTTRPPPASDCMEVTVWLRGGLQLHTLVTRIIHSAKQALCEYMLEMKAINEPLALPSPLTGSIIETVNAPFGSEAEPPMLSVQVVRKHCPTGFYFILTRARILVGCYSRW